MEANFNSKPSHPARYPNLRDDEFFTNSTGSHELPTDRAVDSREATSLGFEQRSVVPTETTQRTGGTAIMGVLSQ